MYAIRTYHEKYTRAIRLSTNNALFFHIFRTQPRKLIKINTFVPIKQTVKLTETNSVYKYIYNIMNNIYCNYVI